MAKKGNSLTPKREKFCIEYVKNGQQARAAYKSAYDSGNMKDAVISVKASELLKIEAISERISELKEKLAKAVEKKFNLTVEDVAMRIDNLAVSADKEEVQLKANEALMKYLGGYEKHNEQKKDEAPTVVVNLGSGLDPDETT